MTKTLLQIDFYFAKFLAHDVTVATQFPHVLTHGLLPLMLTALVNPTRFSRVTG